MKSGYFMAGVTVGLFVVILIKLLFRNKLKQAYDERQKQVQGNAYKYAFFTLLFWCLAESTLRMDGLCLWWDDFTGAIIGLCISITVFAGICIFADAYYSLSRRRKSYIILFGAAGICNLLPGINAIQEGAIVEDGMLTYLSVNLIVGGMLILIMLFTLAKAIMERGEQE